MIERKIIIGLIISTEYCQKIKEIWNLQLIESPTARRIAGWVWEYFDKFSRAPGKDIEPIFYAKLRETRLAKELAKEIEEDILPSLSEEYSQEGFNLEYLLQETEKYLNEQHIKLLTQNIQTLLSTGKVEEADKLVREFKPLGFVSGRLDQFIQTIEQIRRQNRPHPTVLIKPWLKEGQTTIIYGPYGSGKSLLTISIAYLLGLRDFDREECEIGEWQVKHPTGCLYLDGELGEQEMEDRVKQFEWLGRQAGEFRMRILSVPEYQLRTEDTFYLSDRTNQLKIVKWLREHPAYKLVVLDSASTLFGLLEENDNSEWCNKMNPFLRDLRALDVACILLHHAGKDNKKGLRGASAMGAMAHNIFRLTNHGSKAMEKGEAWFVLDKDKQRASGYSFKRFALRYYQENSEKETHWEVTKTNDD